MRTRAAPHLPVGGQQRRGGFGRAGGEHDMFGPGVDQRRDLAPARLDQPPRGAALGMDR